MGVVVVLAAAGALVAALVGVVAYSGGRLYHDLASAKEQPTPNLVTNARVPSVIYGANGSVIATLRSSLYRQPVKLSRISPILVNAVLDTEDHSFWLHGGLDVEATIRALLADVSAGAVVQGGSTIAQQLVKDTFLSDQRTLGRKVREGVLAERLEDKYTKAQILDAYLNSVYLGSGAYGVHAAAKEYFNKDADQVDLAEAALLAGLIQAPSGYDPITNPEGARVRRSEVLSRMVYYKSVSATQAAAANQVPLPTTVNEAPGISYTSYGYYVEQVVDELLDNPALGTTRAQRFTALFSGGLKIYTNEVPSLQSHAQQVAVADIPSSLEHVVAAFAVIDPKNGNVEALVGGPKPGTDQFDDAVQGERQPGSGFKLFTLIAALEDGYNPNDSIFAASPCAVVFPGVPLQYGYNLNRLMNNDPGDPNGPVTLIQATALSINCAFLRLAHQVSLPKVIEVAKSMGLSDPTLNPSNPSLVIGTETVRPIEMAAAYATVADGGIYHAPSFVNRVVDRSGNVIYNGERPGRRVFSAQVAAEAVLALRATVQYGTGTAAALPNTDVAGKTGTTENSVDAWFNGITPSLVSSVWIGDPNGELPMYVDGVEVYGADYPTEIWHDVMAYALSTTPYAAFPAPAPYLMPPLEYIDSPTLEEDDLTSHGGIGPGDCVWNGTLVPCVTTTIPVPTTAGPTITTSVPASTTAPGSIPGTTTSSTFVPGAGGPGATTPGVPTPGSATPGALTPGTATQGTSTLTPGSTTQGTSTLATAVPPDSPSTSAFATPSGASGAGTNGAASPTSAAAPTSSPTSAVPPSSTVPAAGPGQGQIHGGGPGQGRGQYSQVGP